MTVFLDMCVGIQLKLHLGLQLSCHLYLPEKEEEDETGSYLGD